MNQEKLFLSVAVALESAHFFSAFLPSVFTIGTFVRDAQGVALIRKGEAYAAVSAVALGLAVSKLVDSSLPLWFVLVVVAVMLWVYEQALNEPR